MIRPAVIDDLQALLKLAERMHEESPRFSRVPPSRTRMSQTLIRLMSDTYGFAWVAEDDGEPVGMMLGLAAPHWGCEALAACDLLLYVLPEHRGGRTAPALVERFRDWTREIGCHLVTVGVTAGINNEGAARLYERQGFTRCGVLLEVS